MIMHKQVFNSGCSGKTKKGWYMVWCPTNMNKSSATNESDR